MADLRIPGAGLPAVQPAAPRNAAVRAAQRAFFEAALNNAAPVQSARPTSAAATVQTASRMATTSPASAQTDAEPVRYARPGSILDIKV